MTPDRLAIVVVLGLLIVAAVSVAAVLLLREAARQDLETRVKIAIGELTLSADGASRSIGEVLGDQLLRLGNAVRRSTRLYSPQDLATLEGMIVASGHSPRRVLPMVLGGKLVMTAVVPLAVFAGLGVTGSSQALRIAATVVALPVGLLIPDWIIGILRRPYVKALRAGVSDALDLLVVCTEAGMGLESALEQVAREMRQSNRPMAIALNSLVDELRVLPDRKEALINFGTRTGVDGIRRMSTMLAQSLNYGTPLGVALRAVAAELRRERMARLEERAVRLPALLVFPLVFFIMPSLFIVMGGLPLLKLSEVLGSVGH